jgi:hypothetical protein
LTQSTLQNKTKKHFESFVLKKKRRQLVQDLLLVVVVVALFSQV